MVNSETFLRLARQAWDSDIRLEMANGIPTWEMMPLGRHQREVFRIESSIRAAVLGDAPCGCHHYADLQIMFPDGSRKRPDVSIFCQEPEMDKEATLLPEAVIEVLSEDYEAKDLLVGVPFYRQVGIKDIFVLDPRNGDVRHWRQGQPEKQYKSPVTLTLLCGCVCTV